MLKKTISAALALSLVLGGGALLPEGVFGADSAIVAQAAETYGDYEYEVDDDGFVEITKYNGNAANIDIPSAINGKTVKTIGWYSFSECNRIKTVNIPSTVEVIEDFAFDNCISLEKVTMTNSVKVIERAFQGCVSLKSVNLSNNLDSVGGQFNGCTSLKSLVIPEGVISIGGCAFHECENLQSITIPKSVVLIDESAFQSASSTAHAMCDKLVVKCYKNSVAHKFVKKYNYDYQLIDGTSIAKAKVTGLKAQTYTGSNVRPEPVVKLGGKTLKNGTDYYLTYKNNKAVGTATINIIGKRDYTGKITKTFKINPKASKVSKLTSPKTKKLKVTYKKVSGVTGYEVTYSTSKKFAKSKTKTVKVKGAAKTSKTISKLKKNKTYYVKVRTYKTVKGKTYYSSYSKYKKLKIK